MVVSILRAGLALIAILFSFFFALYYYEAPAKDKKRKFYYGCSKGQTAHGIISVIFAVTYIIFLFLTKRNVFMLQKVMLLLGILLLMYCFSFEEKKRKARENAPKLFKICQNFWTIIVIVVIATQVYYFCNLQKFEVKQANEKTYEILPEYQEGKENVVFGSTNFTSFLQNDPKYWIPSFGKDQKLIEFDLVNPEIIIISDSDTAKIVKEYSNISFEQNDIWNFLEGKEKVKYTLYLTK